MNRTGALVIAAALAAITLTGCNPELTPTQPAQPKATSATLATAPAPSVAPTTAAGFQAMFDKVSVNEWGGGDVSVSVKIADGRTIWLYGDTLSKTNGMVNSSALVQTGGTLHVSDSGRQLLPEAGTIDGRKGVYWIETAKHLGDNRVQVTAAHMSIGTTDAWDFKRATAKSRTATLTVATSGDVRFDGWTGWVAEPRVDKTLLGEWQGVPADRAADKGAVFYRKNAHAQFKLDSGKVLHTICANRTDGSLADLKAYRPIFVESVRAA